MNLEFNTLFLKATEAYLPEIKNPDDPQSFEQDFSGISSRASVILVEITQKIQDFPNEFRENFEDKSFINNFSAVIALCGEHSDKSPWTSDKSVNSAKSLLRTVASTLNLKNHEKMITKMAPSILKILSPKLEKQTFAAFPAAVSTFLYVLFSHKHPQLSDVLHLVLPTALILVDDFRQENRLKGLSCVFHILQQTDSAELLRYGRAELLFDALRPLQYQHDLEIIKSLYSALFLCMKIASPHPNSPTTWLKISVWDETTNILLNNLNLVQENEQKLAYLDVLLELLDFVKMRFVRFLPPALKIVEEYLEVQTGSEDQFMKVLKVLETIVRHCSPRMQDHEEISWFLIKFSHDSVTLKPEIWDRLKEKVRNCMKLYENSATEVVTRFKTDLKMNGSEIELPVKNAINYLMM